MYGLDRRPEKTLEFLVLGLGNEICSDDGVGPFVARWLSENYREPCGARFVDGGTLGLSLLPLLESARDVLVVDAVRADAAPGTIVLLEGPDVASALAPRLSPHQVGVADLLDALAWSDAPPERIVVVGVVPATIELGLARSPAVEAALPSLLAATVRQASALGHELPLRQTDGAVGLLHG